MKLFRRLQYLLRQRRIEAELAEELEAHRALRQHDLEARGIDAAAAAQASRRALGNVTLAREDARAIWVPPSLDSIVRDTRYAVRTLVRQPGFAAVAVGTMAAAIGLNTSVFTVFSAYAFRPWPVPEPARVVRVFSGQGSGNFSLTAATQLADATTFEGVFAARSAGNNVVGEDNARVFWVTGNYFRVLHVAPAMGQAFEATHDRLNAPAVAVLSHGYWQRRFGGDPSLVGRTVTIEDVPVTILGVAPREFLGTSPERTDLWMPLSAAATFRPTERWVRDEILRPSAKRPLGGVLMVAGRLKPGVTREQAESELTLLAARGRETERRAAIRTEDTTLLGGPKGDGASVFGSMFAGMTLVLLLACANVGNLLLARATARRREIAVRLSLGASRLRVVRQLLTESFILAIVAAVFGVAIAAYLPSVIIGWISDRPTALQLEPDALVLGYALALSAVASIVFGLAPALHATRAGVAVALKDGPPSRGGWFSLRSILLSSQVALSVVLLLSAALLLRGVWHARGLDHGFDLDAVSVVTFDVPRTAYDAAKTTAFTNELRDALATAPSLTSLTQAVPFGSGNIKGSYRTAAMPAGDDTEPNSVYEMSPAYFDVLGMSLVAGRTLRSTDAPGSAIVVNESLARQLGDPRAVIGQQLIIPADNGWNVPGSPAIVGVVRDAHTASLIEAYPTIYQPISGRSIPSVLTRAGDAAALGVIEAAVTRFDPRVRMRVNPLADGVDARLRGGRTFATLAAMVGVLALGLATVGMFGVFAFWVQQRRQEIGIRMALGARASDVIRIVMGSSVVAIGVGLAIGFAGAFVAGGVMRSSLYGLSVLDPVAYGAVGLVLACAALVATLVPARRAVTVDPALTLRQG